VPRHHPFLCATVGAALAAPCAAQSPRTADPERPTVATHAYAVAPGYVELEQGVRVIDPGGPPVTSWEFNLKLGVTPSLQVAFFGTALTRSPAGTGGDVGFAFKVRRDLSPRAAVALVPQLTLPTGRAALGYGAGRALGGLVGVLSADLPGHLHLDVNAGVLGLGAGVPQGLGTVSGGVAAGRFGVQSEVYRIGPGGAGAGQSGWLLAGTVAPAPWLVLDLGHVVALSSGGGAQWVAGGTVNLGRMFKWRAPLTGLRSAATM